MFEKGEWSAGTVVGEWSASTVVGRWEGGIEAAAVKQGMRY
jgi:hypothetical protein